LKSVLITGAAGFLGSHLCEKLLNEGYIVIGVDNFSTGLASNARHLEKFSKGFKFVEADVVEPWTWAKNLKDLKYIFHFASPASPPLYQKLSLETIRVNTIGLENSLQCAEKTGARVIFASTSEIYGDPEFSPQKETYWGNVNSFGPRSCYDESKRLGEAILFEYNLKKGSRHGLVRIFNTYGPRMNPADGRVVINFLVQGMSGQKLTIHGDGKQTRSFCYVDDLINGIWAYAQKDIYEPVNLGSEFQFTILELAQKVQKLFPEKKLEIEFQNRPVDDPQDRRPDLTKARKLLSPWDSNTPLEVGLKHMLTWLQSR
jgi:nucleoside-diphosphate-sugar epimerase